MVDHDKFCRKLLICRSRSGLRGRCFSNVSNELAAPLRSNLVDRNRLKSCRHYLRTTSHFCLEMVDRKLQRCRSPTLSGGRLCKEHSTNNETSSESAKPARPSQMPITQWSSQRSTLQVHNLRYDLWSPLNRSMHCQSSPQ